MTEVHVESERRVESEGFALYGFLETQKQFLIVISTGYTRTTAHDVFVFPDHLDN